jgi:hypothetical protein
MKIPATLRGETVYIVAFLGPSPVYAVCVDREGGIRLVQSHTVTVLPFDPYTHASFLPSVPPPAAGGLLLIGAEDEV